MTRLAQGFAVVFAVILVGFGPGLRAAEAMPPVDEMLQDMMIGDAKAPVTIIEYASLGCPHCRAFHTETLPKIKKKYVDTGKVKLIFRDFPLGTPALAASMIARCSGPARYFGMVEILFRDQDNWAHGQDVIGSLEASAKKGGMGPTQVDECLRLEPLLLGIRQIAENAQQQYGVRSTPSFIIQGELVEGALPFEAFAQIIDKALK